MILRYIQGCFMKLLFVTLTLLLVNAVPASAQIESVGAASPAHPSSASAVVRQFYAWYMKMLETHSYNGGAFGADYLAPVRGLFDERFYWLLKQENENHPGSKARGMECSLDENPFVLGQGLGRLVGFTVGSPIAQSNAIVVPVTLFMSSPPAYARPGFPRKITAIVKDEGGAYKIYDIESDPQFLDRQFLEKLARDPDCAWPK